MTLAENEMFSFVKYSFYDVPLNKKQKLCEYKCLEYKGKFYIYV